MTIARTVSVAPVIARHDHAIAAFTSAWTRSFRPADFYTKRVPVETRISGITVNISECVVFDESAASSVLGEGQMAVNELKAASQAFAEWQNRRDREYADFRQNWDGASPLCFIR